MPCSPNHAGPPRHPASLQDHFRILKSGVVGILSDMADAASVERSVREACATAVTALVYEVAQERKDFLFFSLVDVWQQPAKDDEVAAASRFVYVHNPFCVTCASHPAAPAVRHHHRRAVHLTGCAPPPPQVRPCQPAERGVRTHEQAAARSVQRPEEG